MSRHAATVFVLWQDHHEREDMRHVEPRKFKFTKKHTLERATIP